jgi:hypothetical protein
MSRFIPVVSHESNLYCVSTKFTNQLPLFATYRVFTVHKSNFYIHDTLEDGRIAETCSVICVQ